MCLVTRGRPEAAMQALKAWQENRTDASDFLLVLDNDDGHNYLGYAAFQECMREVLPPAHVGPQLNKVAVKYAPKYAAIGFIGDDHRIKTKGFDKIWLDALLALPYGVVYGDDLACGESWAGQCAMSSEIIETLGYMHDPKLQHQYIDNCWMEIAKALGTLKYTPSVIIEHLHMTLGKRAWDENDKKQYALRDTDMATFTLWRNGGEYAAAIEKLKKKLFPNFNEGINEMLAVLEKAT